jgi:hypothetical protein
MWSEGSQSLQTVNYSNGSLGTRNHGTKDHCAGEDQQQFGSHLVVRTQPAGNDVNIEAEE